MKNIILVFCTILAAAKTQYIDWPVISISAERSEDYIKSHRARNARAVAEFDERVKTFENYYTGRIESLNMQIPRTLATVTQVKEHFTALELMSDFSNKCVTKYSNKLPCVITAKTSMEQCSVKVPKELPDLLIQPFRYRSELSNYLETNFEAELTECGNSFNKTSTNYTTCITRVISDVNIPIIRYQKIFDNMMDEAECEAKTNLKSIVDCISILQWSTISQVLAANISIYNCLLGKEEECEPCPETCSETLDFQVDFKNKTINNPFYAAEGHSGCLLLNLN